MVKADSKDDNDSDVKPTLSELEFCSIPEDPPRDFDGDVHPGRAAAILDGNRKWVSGTTLRYYFFGPDEFEWDRRRFSWGGDASQKQVVREAFEAWGDVGIGIDFLEVDDVNEAEIRIGFVRGDGSWSWLGRRILDEPINARTTNFGWNLIGDADTAIHEIGHILGMPHEHQNPFSGIVWDEEKVYADLAKPPNRWSRQKTFYNILRKLPETSVSGSKWDKDSIMHYPFQAGMIKVPVKYQTEPLVPAGGLSTADRRWAKKWYPPVKSRLPLLVPFESEHVQIAPGEQVNYRIEPKATRKYTMRTLGDADTVMVLFEEVDGEWRYRAGADDSGYDLNAILTQKLFKGRHYELRIRLYWAGDSGDFGVVMY